MSGSRSYFAAAFNARPFGMPIPPNWFAVAAFALLGAFVNPGLWLVGAGLEGLYLWALSRNERFRATVDAEGKGDDWHSKYNSLTTNLDDEAQRKQAFIEARVGDHRCVVASRRDGFAEERCETDGVASFEAARCTGVGIASDCGGGFGETFA